MGGSTLTPPAPLDSAGRALRRREPGRRLRVPAECGRLCGAVRPPVQAPPVYALTDIRRLPLRWVPLSRGESASDRLRVSEQSLLSPCLNVARFTRPRLFSLTRQVPLAVENGSVSRFLPPRVDPDSETACAPESLQHKLNNADVYIIKGTELAFASPPEVISPPHAASLCRCSVGSIGGYRC